MVDGIKFSILHSANLNLLENPYLDFEQRNIGRDGEFLEAFDKNGNTKKDQNGNVLLKTPYLQATYRGLSFKVFDSGYVEVTGSLHKYFNEGIHNHNDFNRENLISVLNDLKSRFGIDQKNTSIHSIEFGVNLYNLPYDTSLIVDHCLMHSTKFFEERYNSNKGKYIQAQHSQMTLKIYDKAKQYRGMDLNVMDEILRIEIKVTRMEYLKKKGIRISSLWSLLTLDYGRISEQLLKEWGKVLFYDFTSTLTSSSSLQYRDKIFWKEKLSRPSRSAFEKHRSKLRSLTVKNSERVQLFISNKIEEKIFNLIVGVREITPCI